MAPESIPSGSNYKKEIPNAIKECKVVVLIMSEKAQKSYWVDKEIEKALSENKRIIPYKIEVCDLLEDFDFVFRDIQQIYAYEDEEKALTQIINDLRHYLKSDADDKIETYIPPKKRSVHTL